MLIGFLESKVLKCIRNSDLHYNVSFLSRLPFVVLDLRTCVANVNFAIINSVASVLELSFLIVN